MHKLKYLFLFLFVASKAYSLNFVDEYLLNSPEIDEAKLEIEKLENQVKQVRGSLFPEVSWSNTQTKIKNITAFTGSATIYASKLEITQPIYTGGKLFAALDLAKEELKIAKLNLKMTTEASKLRAFNFLLKLRNQKEKIKIAKDQLGIQQKNRSIIQKKSKLGNAKSYELPQAEADLIARKVQLEQLQIEFKKLEKEISSYVKNWKELTKDPWNPSQDIQFLEQQSLFKNNFELQNLDLQMKNLKLNQKIDLGDDRPTIALSASEGYQSTEASGLFDESNRSSQIVISANVPLFSGLSSVYKKKFHNNSIAILERQIQDTRRSVALSYNQLQEELGQKKILLKSFEEWKKFAKKSLLEAQKSYRIGRINFLQLTQVQQSLDNAESSYWDTWFDFHTKRLQMLNLQGQIL
ncbi:MAG: TolC family protein [Bdellovibrionota bacterium]|nr:TolC family protein [Bdellovibrionota bacterium]